MVASIMSCIFVLSEKDRGCPDFRLAVAIVEQKGFSFRLNDSLTIFRNSFDSLVARDNNPVVFPVLLDPVRIKNALVYIVWGNNILDKVYYCPCQQRRWSTKPQMQPVQN